MAEKFIEDDVRTRLILSGVREIEENGIGDFSLRRAAEAARVSCAAPYRHFKSKEAYISAIYSYLAGMWSLMLSEIERSFPFDKKAVFKEAFLANVKFWLANKNLRSGISFFDGSSEISLSDFDSKIFKTAEEYFASKKTPKEEIVTKISLLRSALYGYIALYDKSKHSCGGEYFGQIEKSLDSVLN